MSLTQEQRENLEQISRNGYASAKKILHGRILLMCRDLARFISQMEVILDLYGSEPCEDEPYGSWLNVAEIELSVLSKQCLDRIIPNVEELNQELKAWQKDRNQTLSKVIWKFSTNDARVKLKHLYPVFEEEEPTETIALF